MTKPERRDAPWIVAAFVFVAIVIVVDGYGCTEGEREMTRQPWTPADDERLRKLAAEGRSVATIAERLKRSESAIRRRAKDLGITLVKTKGK